MTALGICYLVGAGPGDPGLITVRGLQCIRKAQVIFYDHLVADDLLAEAQPGTKLHYVGKVPGGHSMPQEQISVLVCEAVRSGKITVRLKGGDPFVFGRGGEEALALSRAGLPFEVVPGVTAGVSAPAYAGIPVTHRKISTAVTFVTGHESADKPSSQTAWDELARCKHTLCVYMGLKNLPHICERLLRGGRAPTEPAAVIEAGTYPQQRVVIGTLADIVARCGREQIRPPALIVIGEVVALSKELDWYGHLAHTSRLDVQPHEALVDDELRAASGSG